MSIATKPKAAVNGKPAASRQSKPGGKQAPMGRKTAGPATAGNAVMSRTATYAAAPSNQTSTERNVSNSELTTAVSPARAQGQPLESTNQAPSTQSMATQSTAVEANAGTPKSTATSQRTDVPTASAVSVAESPASATGEKANKTEAGPSAEMQSVVGEIQAAGASAREHDSPEKKGAETQQAMGLPAAQASSIAQSQKMSSLASQTPPPFNREDFKKKLHDRIKALQADDAKAIKDGDKANQINQAVKGEVAAGKEAASGGIQQANAQTPTGGPTPIPGKEIPAAPLKPAPKIDASRAAPQPVPDSKTSLAGESQALDQKMASAKVTPEQLARSNEQEFQAAADARVNAQTQAAAVPAQVRAQEATVLGQTKSSLAATTATGIGTMHGSRKQSMGAVSDQQIATKAKREATKAKLTTSVNGIYDRVNQAVTERLKSMDELVKTTFDEGASAAKTNFNLFLVEEVLKYFVGGGWIVDALTEGNDYKAIFDRGREEYMNEMDLVIDNVARVVETAMNEIVAMVQKAKTEIDDLIIALPEEDRAVGEEVAEVARGKFAELQSTIEQKQQEVVDDISQKFVTAVKEVDALISTLKDPVGAIISAAVDMLSGVIETIMKMRELLMSIASKAGEAIDLILADPIGFLANLIAGVKQGVENFVANIGTYLKAGLLEWLFGALAGAGIKMPEKFDLSGLLSIVLQVLGLTYDNFRKRAVNILGEPTVAAIEKASEIFMILMTKGAAGLWEFIQEQATAFLEIVKEGVKSLVIENVIKAGVKWIIGLLNPASAFVKACMAIYDIVSFVITKGVQILEFVNAVVGSILSIAKGTIAPAAQAVEAALAKSVPVAIGFLASLLGLGDISKDIKAVIDKIQAPVNKVIDWLIKKAVKLVKAIGRAFGASKSDKSSTEKADLEVSKPATMAGHGHEVVVQVVNGTTEIKLASGNPRSLRGLVMRLHDRIKKSNISEAKKQLVSTELTLLASELNKSEREIEKIVKNYYDKGYGGRHNAPLSVADMQTLMNNSVQDLAGHIIKLGEKHGFTDLELDLDRSNDTGITYWDIGVGARGEIIERIVGQNLSQQFPVMDRFDKATGDASSIKSSDLSRKTLADPAKFESICQSYVDKASGFDGGKDRTTQLEIEAGEVKNRQLIVAIPKNIPVSNDHLNVIIRATVYGLKASPKVKVIIVKI